jgi:hypothetical protein
MTARVYLYGACILLLAASGCGEFENGRATDDVGVMFRVPPSACGSGGGTAEILYAG